MLAVEFKSVRKAALVLGHAVAIDTNGYFLTAAHCVDFPVNYLVYSDGESASIGVPRIVTKISGPSRKLDLALIHVNARVPDIFALDSANDSRRGSPVMAVGSSQVQLLSCSLTNWGVLKNVCFAGHVLSVSHLHDGSEIVYGNLPTRSGDSGGPLVSTNGTLMGVHVGEWTGWPWRNKSIAVLPSQSRITKIIQEDDQHLTNHPQTGSSLNLAPLTSFDSKMSGAVIWLN